MNMAKKQRLSQLATPFEKSSVTWDEYPRPQMRRSSYISLCGEWDLSVLKSGVETPLGAIVVPFPPESRISGIQRTLEAGEKYIYSKSFVLPENFNKGRVLLHFGAVDQIAVVRVNDRMMGELISTEFPAGFDITEALVSGENHIRVQVTDELDTDIPYGKQCRKRGGMWYTPISGIWQQVWLESVPDNYIRSLKLTPTLDSITMEIDGGGDEKKVSIRSENGGIVHSFTGNRTTIPISEPVLWSPEAPYLYEFVLTCGEDEIHSYFALRTVTTEIVNGVPRICLNGKPYFFHGLLDQGYFSDGIYTPASPEGYQWDILQMKKLGFNMLRKHIKIEPDLFYYYCDKYGMIVFQDMVNSGSYNFLIDTALPTIGLRRGIKHRASGKRRDIFEAAAKRLTEQLYNHPCVCYYTIFNEGWGQYDADRIYSELKAFDPTRIWDATSGWFTEKESDVKSEHIYFRKIDIRPHSSRPLVLSEFGGYSCRIDGHCFNQDDNYGYKIFDTPESLTDGLSSLYRNEIIPSIRKGLCAAVITQLSDVEDETNGMCTYDRQVIKVDEEIMRNIADDIHDEFRSVISEIAGIESD